MIHDNVSELFDFLNLVLCVIMILIVIPTVIAIQSVEMVTGLKMQDIAGKMRSAMTEIQSLVMDALQLVH